VLYLLLFLYIENIVVQQYIGYEKYADREIDALIVFFGGFGVDGDLGRESLRRLALAVELHKRHIGKNIIFVGGWRPSRYLRGSRLMAERAVEAGIKSSNIFYDMSSRDTLQNWREAEKIIIENNFKEVILISSVFHLIRIERIIKMRNDIKGFYASYRETNALPPKSLWESFSDYNYNVISFMAYLILPSCFYQAIIDEVRD
jgi:vancomycin permeability regulator SanA